MNREEFEGMVRAHRDFDGVPAGNRPVRISGDAFDRVQDGKLVEHHAQFVLMFLMVQIGAVPVPS